jgi:O-antigen/teichoic acid export membrane protein
MWLESFSWSLKKGVLSNILKETVVRFIFTIILALFVLKLINADSLFFLFSISFILPAVILFFVLRKSGDFAFHTSISPVTLKYKSKMINFGLFLFGAQFLNLLSRTADTFILAAKSSRGLTDSGVFTIATYVITLMEVPQRSISSITIPVLAESWKNNDLKNIRHVYVKSVNNLLVIGLGMFCVLTLNAHNMAAYMGTNYSGIEQVVMVIGIGKLIDLGTGANGQIISTSSYWKTDFVTNVIYTLLALPLNYFLIAKYGLMGAAYSSLISLTFYNLMRFGFLWYIFKLQPYNIKDLYAIVIAVICGVISYYIPKNPLIFVDAFVRTSIFLVLFVPAIYFARVSEELNEMLLKYLNMVRRNQR